MRKWRNTPERASLEMLYDVGTHESLEEVLRRWDQSRPDVALHASRRLREPTEQPSSSDGRLPGPRSILRKGIPMDTFEAIHQRRSVKAEVAP